MWSTSKSQAAKRLAPILQKETSKTSETEWLRYSETIDQITELVSGFELTDVQAKEMKKHMSKETSQQLRSESVCKIVALDVRTGKSCNLTLIKKSEDKLVLDWSYCIGCDVGLTIDFDFYNTFWEDHYHSGCDKLFYATN